MNRFNDSSIRTAFTALAVESREREPHRAVGVGGHRADRRRGACCRRRIRRRSRCRRRRKTPSAHSWASAPCTRRNPRVDPPPRLRAAAIADRPRRVLLPSSILRGRRRGSDLTSVVAVLRRQEAPESWPRCSDAANQAGRKGGRRSRAAEDVCEEGDNDGSRGIPEDGLMIYLLHSPMNAERQQCLCHMGWKTSSTNSAWLTELCIFFSKCRSW